MKIVMTQRAGQKLGLFDKQGNLRGFVQSPELVELSTEDELERESFPVGRVFRVVSVSERGAVRLEVVS